MTDVEQNYTLDAEVFTQNVFANYGYVLDGNGRPVGQSVQTYLDTATMMLGANVVFTVNGQPVADADVSVDFDFNDDGFITRADAQLLMDHIIKGTELVANQDHTDVDGDGDTDTHDAYTLLTMIKSQTDFQLSRYAS